MATGHHRAFLRQDAVAEATVVGGLLLLAAAIDGVAAQQRDQQAGARQQHRVAKQFVQERGFRHRCGLHARRRLLHGHRGGSRGSRRGCGGVCLRCRSGGRCSHSGCGRRGGIGCGSRCSCRGGRGRRGRGRARRGSRRVGRLGWLGRHHGRRGAGRRRGRRSSRGRSRLGLVQLGDLGILQLHQALHVRDVLLELGQLRLGVLELALRGHFGFGLGLRLGLRGAVRLAQLQFVALTSGRHRGVLHARGHVAGLLAARARFHGLCGGGGGQTAAIAVETLRARHDFAAGFARAHGLRLLGARHLQHRAGLDPVDVAADECIRIIPIQREQHLLERHILALRGIACNAGQRVAALDRV
ncbi:hypothetical protein D3C86_1138720 [compost metagenome]